MDPAPSIDTHDREVRADREEAAEELGNSGESCPVAVVLGQAAAEQTQPALPDAHGKRASRVQQLPRSAALQIPRHWLETRRGPGPRAAQRIEHNDHADRCEKQDDPAVRRGRGGQIQKWIKKKERKQKTIQ